MRTGWLWSVVTVLWVLTGDLAQAEGRHALVVGQDRYIHLPALKKAGNDAKAVAEALRGTGFQTDLVLDADEDHLLNALTSFGGRLSPGDEAVFFFAGHGVEIDGQNYLLPTDMPAVEPGKELVLKRRSLVLEDVLTETANRGVRVSLMIIDACRDNPFPKRGGRSAGSTRGLARIDPPQGTFVLYSAGAGQTALDRLSEADTNPNSVFTRVLLPEIAKPGLDLRSMVQDLRAEVRKTAATVQHDQFPAIYDQLEGEFSFMPVAAAAPTPIAPAADLCTQARSDWALVQTTKSAEVLQDYLSLYGRCKLMAGLARERLGSLGGTPAPEIKQSVKAPPPPKATKPLPPVLTVSANGTGNYRTIAEAVAAAKPGSRIEIRPGHYKGGVIIDKPVNLVGIGDRATIIWEASREHLIYWKAASGQINNLTLRQKSEPNKFIGAVGFSTVVFDNGSATLENNNLSSTDAAVVVVTGATADPIIRLNSIQDGRKNGIVIQGYGKARIHGNEIWRNGSAGIAIWDGGFGSVIKNRIHSNFTGILVRARGQGLIFANILRGNDYRGLLVEKDAGKVTETENLK